MRKQDIPIIVVLFAALWGWPYIVSKISPPPAKVEAPADGTNSIAAVSNAISVGVSVDASAITAPAPVPNSISTSVPVAATPADGTEPARHATAAPEFAAVSNDVAEVTVSSWGGSIVSVQLIQKEKGRNVYPKENTPDSPPLVLDFSSKPALSYSGVKGLSTNADFKLEQKAREIIVSTTTESGLQFQRTISLGDSYNMTVSDVFSNSTDRPILVPEHLLNSGPMKRASAKVKDVSGFVFLGLDSQAAFGGEKPLHWGAGNMLAGEFGKPGGFMCAKGPPAKRFPVSISIATNIPAYWVAAKDKFFTQILSTDQDHASDAMVMNASRLVPDAEAAAPENPATWASSVLLMEVSTSLQYSEKTLDPGATITRNLNYYAGPKKHSILKAIGREAVMEFGFWAFLCRLLLPVLNGLYSVIPNYGIAIILLTLLIRLVFWPVMNKSTQSMKKMQEIQPMLKELREKYGKDQEKYLREQQRLFKENKVNPLGGCLPLLIQIPVFIALFTVLRSAVELRFAGFLWVHDLSEQEALFASQLGFPVNILPILMTVTMVWQQKLTPSGGDPQQQKMMAVIMPVMMLFFFYTMPSALVLYWTTSQCLTIASVGWKKRSELKKKLSAGKLPEKKK